MIDRWHVLKNLREAIERFLSHTPIPEEMREEAGQAIPRRQKRTRGEQARSQGSRQRRLALYEQVVELSSQGRSIQGIARQLQISRQTVRKCIQAPHFPEQQKHAQTTSAIDPYRPYLHQRWQEEHPTTSQLWTELQERGFTGSWMMVYRWVQLQQEKPDERINHAQQKTLRVAKKMAPRQLAWLFLHDVEQLEKQDRQMLTRLRQAPQIEVVYGFAQQFVRMMKEHDTTSLDAWLVACQMSGINDLVTFAQGLEQEGSALYAAFTLPYSNGPVEGKINKLKYIKRSMYGRSAFPLLRQKVLKAG